MKILGFRMVPVTSLRPLRVRARRRSGRKRRRVRAGIILQTKEVQHE